MKLNNSKLLLIAVTIFVSGCAGQVRDDPVLEKLNSYMKMREEYGELIHMLVCEKWLAHKYLNINAIMQGTANINNSPVIITDNNVTVYNYPIELRNPEPYKTYAYRYNSLKINEADYLYENNCAERALVILNALNVYCPEMINSTQARINDISNRISAADYAAKYSKGKTYIPIWSRYIFGTVITTNETVDIDIEKMQRAKAH